MTSGKARVHSSDEGENADSFGITRRIRLGPEDTGGRFGLFEETVPAGIGPPLHIHEREDELFTILEGRVRYRCSGEEHEAGPGATVFIPMGAEHAFKALTTARMLIMLMPGEGIGFFRAVTREGLSPAAHMARITEIAAGTGLRFTGPPLD